MTTYAGRSAQYVPGRDVPNKEPPVSKFVVEKLYRVHRLRMAKIAPLVDCHVHIPDFLTNTTWKENAEKARQARIAAQNLYMFNRISKVENGESEYKKEAKAHVRRIDHKAAYLKKLKTQDRIHKNYKIERENEYILKRIEKAQPEYTKKKMDEWYNYHELFKAGRRADPTAGHIMKGMGDLSPLRLKPLGNITGSFLQSSSTLSLYSPQNLRSSTQPSASELYSPRSESKILRRANPMMGALEGAHIVRVAPPPSDSSALSSPDKSSYSGYRSISPMAMEGEEGGYDVLDAYAGGLLHTSPAHSVHAAHAHPAHSARPLVAHVHVSPKPHTSKQTRSTSDPPISLESESLSSKSQEISTKTPFQLATEDLYLLISRPFALPFESKSCSVQVFTSKTYAESLQLKVVSSGISPQILCERTLHIDKAYEVVNSGQSSLAIHSSENGDLASLSALLITMFQEADNDGSGSLTFDEFQVLMEQVELGISPQELRFVISEADENENGVVDYEEFVPLAVDLIQSFRARNRAKTINSALDVELDELIMRSISTEELEQSALVCLEKIHTIDTKRYGLIRAIELKRALNSVAVNANVKENEISMICQMLPRDQFDRCKYNAQPSTFLEILSKVRFMTMKNAMIESQGSGLQKYLLDLCRDEEIRIADGVGNIKSRENLVGMGLNKSKENFSATGNIPFRALINILTNSSRLSLSRLQVLVIMSEAHVQEGMINYFHFVPVVSKAIELMFEPKALRQRAELIEKTDLSPEALLQGMSSEMFEQRLMTLFKSYDIDHSGGLDQNEFIACLESLDLQLTYAEMVGLMASADTGHTGVLKFENFVGFFTRNLLSLEREKHIRLLQTSINAQKAVTTEVVAAVTTQEQSDFIEHLTTVFNLYDKDNTGYIHFTDFESVLVKFSLQSSKYLVDVMLTELQVKEDGMVNCKEAILQCNELLQVNRARESALGEHKQKEEWAEAKAAEIMQSHEVELNQITGYLKARILRINEAVSDPSLKYQELVGLFRSPASGLARSEATRLITRLLCSPSDSSSKHEHKHKTAHHSPTHPPHTPVHTVTHAPHTHTPAHPHAHPTPHSAAHPAPTLPRKPTQSHLPPSLSRASSGRLSRSNSCASLDFQNESDKSQGGGVSTTLRPGAPLRSHFKTYELYEAVCEARRITIMRGLLEEVDSSVTRTLLLEALRLEAARLKEQGLLVEFQGQPYLPVTSCFAVLEETRELHLNRSQVMFIISWAECFDKDGTNLDLERFAEHAANIVSKLGDNDLVATRAALATTIVTTEKVLNGLVEGDLQAHLLDAFEKLGEEITPLMLRDVLKNTPKLALHERECTALVTSFCKGEAFHWREQLQDVTALVVTLCRERVVQRRLSLHMSSRSSDMEGLTDKEMGAVEDARSNLRTLADRLLNYVRIQMSGEIMQIHLPIDNVTRRTVQTGEGLYTRIDADQNLLYAGVRQLLWATIDSSPKPARQASLIRTSTSTSTHRQNSMTGGRSPTSAANYIAAAAAVQAAPEYIMTKKGEQKRLFFVTVTSKAALGETQLKAKAVSADGGVCLTLLCAVKLPSLGMVDREAAGQFACAVVDKLYAEEVRGAVQGVELKMRE